MMFSLPVLLALPLAALAAPSPEPSIDVNGHHVEARAADAANGCTIHGQWVTNWTEVGYSRYRVKIWHEGGYDDLNTRWCNYFYNYATNVPGYNPQCWQDGDHALSDVSYPKGPAGYEQYKKSFWDSFNAMSHETGCGLNVDL